LTNKNKYRPVMSFQADHELISKIDSLCLQKNESRNRVLENVVKGALLGSRKSGSSLNKSVNKDKPKVNTLQLEKTSSTSPLKTLALANEALDLRRKIKDGEAMKEEKGLFSGEDSVDLAVNVLKRQEQELKKSLEDGGAGGGPSGLWVLLLPIAIGLVEYFKGKAGSTTAIPTAPDGAGVSAATSKSAQVIAKTGQEEVLS